MENIPVYLSILFIGITALAVFLFYRATQGSLVTLVVIGCWLLLQLLLDLIGFYDNMNAFPPRMVFAVGPAFLLMILLILTPKGRTYIDKLDLKALTILHVIRIPVELVLLALFIYKAVPELMTFEGYNFDIFSGLTAPILYYALSKGKLNPKWLLVWNFICLALLVNIVMIAILSIPYPFQRLAFDQPNLAVLKFPFLWLPSVVVPLVFFSHLVVIRKLMKGKLS